MKRLVVSALFVSVFLIGVSSLIESAGAKFKSDEKALELIRASRAAIGGDQNLVAVRSMSIKAATTYYREKAGVQNVESGSMEINLELPGKFSKRVMIGDPGAAASEAVVEKDVEIVKGDGPVQTDGNGNVFVIRKDGGNNVDWTTESDDNVKVTDGKILIKKGDGTVEEINTDGNQKVIVRKMGDGETIDIVGNDSDDINVFETSDGERMIMKGGHGVHGKSNEMLRTTMALLMAFPDDGSVSFKFAGEGNVDGFPSNIIDVESKGSSFRLYLDAATNLPQMVSYPAMHRRMRVDKEKMSGKNMTDLKREMAAPRTRDMKFTDYRSVGGLLLPFRWTEVSDGKTIQTVDITGYELNPADIDARFGPDGGEGQRVIRKRIEKN